MGERDSEQTGQGGRIEPIADWEHLHFRTDDARPRRGIPAWRGRRVWRWLVAAIVALATLLVVFRQPLANLFWPDTHVQRLLDEGERALREGRLSSPSGTGAREYYEAAQAMDTDRSEARDGLARVAVAALAKARHDIAAEDFAAAHAALALARELQVPRADADAVADRLRKQEATDTGVDALLQQARAAQAEKRLDGSPDAALPLYRRVLALQPNRVEALEGREDALTDLLQRAGDQLRLGDLARAAELIAQARSYDPGHVDLPAAQAQLARALDTARRQADAALRRGRLQIAADTYQSLLAAVPGDEQAQQGLERTAAVYAALARRHAGDFRFAQAETALQRGRGLAPQSPQIKEAGEYLERARVAQTRLGSVGTPRERQRQVNALLAEMVQAETQGHWLTPPGESAYDKLRAAQAVAAEDAEVKRAAARLLPAVRDCFEQEWRSNRVRRAQSCLTAWQTIRPGDAGLPAARRRMAQKWIAVGNERLGSGDVAFAAQALAEARTIDARAPGLAEFAERVNAAQLGKD